MNNNAHIGFIKMAMELSVNACQSGQGLPIGCVIARNDEIAEGHNDVLSLKKRFNHVPGVER